MQFFKCFENYNSSDIDLYIKSKIDNRDVEYLSNTQAPSFISMKKWLLSCVKYKVPTITPEELESWIPRIDKLISDIVKEKQNKLTLREPYFRKSVVRDDNDKLLTLYHGSKHEFTEFKHRPGMRATSLGSGYEVQSPCLFFSDNPEFSDIYGKNLYKVHLDMEYPLEFDTTGWRSFVNKSKQVFKEDEQGTYYIFYDSEDGVLDYLYRANPNSQREITHYLSSGHGHVWEVLDNKEFIDMLSNDYDGIIFYEYEADDYGKGKEVDSKTYAVFDPSQVKIL